jgi:predicted CoA-binding protein
MKTTKHQIDTFLQGKKIGLAGVSRDPKKFGYTVFKELKEKGYEVFPVNPAAESIDSVKVFHRVGELPAEVTHLIVITPKKETEAVVREAVDHGIRNIWIQQMSDTVTALELARSSGVNLVHGECIFMWAEPVKSIHKFHKAIRGFFGMLPK